jgi:hypothetical protein
MKASRTVLNGEDGETGHKALRLVLTQRQRWRLDLYHSVPQRRSRSRAALAAGPCSYAAVAGYQQTYSGGAGPEVTCKLC